MNKYQMAKLVSVAGTIQTRKRVQKIVYLLQAAGLDLGANFRLHHFGPYSSEVAGLLNQMSRDEILAEEKQRNAAGWQSSYSLTEHGKSSITAFEKTPAGQRHMEDFKKIEPQLRKLLKVTNLWELELGATIAYFYAKLQDWDKAVEEACSFKDVRPDAPNTRQALATARGLIQ